MSLTLMCACTDHVCCFFTAGVVTDMARVGAINNLWYRDDFDLMIEATEGVRNTFRKWNAAFESNSLMVDLLKTRVLEALKMVLCLEANVK